MRCSVADVVGVHAVFGSATEIIEQRRALYQLVVELLSDARLDDPEVLDNPVVRAHLGEVLSGADRIRTDELCSLTELVDCRVDLAGHPVRIAGAPSSPSLLAGAVRRVGAELARHGVGPPSVLTVEHPSFGSARARVAAGVELALRAAPELAADLLPHVALFAVLDTQDRFGSASAREYPGLVLVPAPMSVAEAAEALIHEGAHQKFFDLAIVRSIFGPDQYRAPGFEPSWRAGSWPLEQTFAACHTYYCLAAFAQRLESEPPPSSLLPAAGERATEIGRWLWSHRQFLGYDGCALLAALLGEPGPPIPARGAILPAPEGAVTRRFGARTLTAVRARPIDFFWC